MKKIGVSILGLGTIGSSVYKILNEQREFIASMYGFELSIRFILVKNLNKKRNISDTVQLVDDIECILNDTETEIVIECVGGSAVDETYDNVIKLIRAKKNIVFSSKKCLATYRKEIINATLENDVQIRYDATVGGGVPIFHLLDNLYGTDKIQKIYGIVNASTNYILSLMKEEHMDYETAKNLAVQEGLAENDPHEDVDGIDALYKLIILLRFGFGIEGDFENIEPCSFSAHDNQSVKKQIVYAEIDDDISIYVGLADVEGTILENINGRTNIVSMETQYGRTKTIAGIGAGGLETASVMADDCLDILIHKRRIKEVRKNANVMNIAADRFSFFKIK
jgi:homoserine dehydrogenase